MSEPSPPRSFHGKYRGTVFNNVDPMKQGRIQVTVPDVDIAPTTFARPCVPVAGIQSGSFSIPPIGALVWVEFEGGDPDRPIWSGGYWGTAAEIPLLAQALQPPIHGFAFQTPLQNAFVISDAPGPAGGLLIKTTTGATITMNDTGIIIQNGKGASIAMVGPTVTINNGALVIT